MLTRLKYFGHSIGLHLVGQHLNHEAVHNPQLDHSEGTGALAVIGESASRLSSRSARSSSPRMRCVLGLLLFTRWTCSVAESSRPTAGAGASSASWPRTCGPQLDRTKKLSKIIVLSGRPDSLTRHEQKSSAYPCSGSEQSHRKSRHAAARAFLRSRNRPESILVDKNPAAYALVDRWPTTTPLWGNPKTGSE